MFVMVNLEEEPAEVTLAEPDDCTRFHVAVLGHGSTSGRAHAAAVDDGLQTSGSGWLDGEGGAFVRVEWVRTMAEGRAGSDWEGRFSAMLDYARDKGWLSDDGEAIRAHLEGQ